MRFFTNFFTSTFVAKVFVSTFICRLKKFLSVFLLHSDEYGFSIGFVFEVDFLSFGNNLRVDLL